MNRKTLFVALTTLIAGTAQATEIMDLNSLSSKALAEEANTVLDISGFNQNQLQVEASQDLAKSRILRLRQYHLGVPVLSEAVVVESGNSKLYDKVSRVSGRLLVGLDKELPDVEPALSYDHAMSMARQYAGLAAETSNASHLYVDLDDKGAARLVYLIDLEGSKDKSAARVSVLMDANSGVVLDIWNSLDAGDGNGPGQTLLGVRKQLSSMGWSRDQVDTLLLHTAQLYWRDNSKMADTFCGADLAAADLGFSVDDVRMAFSAPDKCRSNTRQAKTGLVDESAETVNVEAVAPSDLAKASLGTKVEDTLAWQQVTTSNIGYLKPYNTAAAAYDRAKVVFTLPWGIHINNFYADVRRDQFRSSWNACGTAADCVHYRAKGTGDRTTTTSYTAWAAIPGYDIKVTPNGSTTGAITVGQHVPWSSAIAKTSGWKVALTQELSYAAKFTFPILAAAETSVTLKVSSTQELNGQTTATITTNHTVPAYKVPKGCEMVEQLQHRWQAYKDTWNVYPEFKGNVLDRDNEDGQIYEKKAASTFFANPNKNATFTIDQQNSYSTQVKVWGRAKGSTSTTTTTGCGLIAV